MSQVRTFIAIKLPEPVLTEIDRLKAELGRQPASSAARWVATPSIHLTLKFLGEIGASRLQDVFDAVDLACAERTPFELTLGDLGCFPNARRPRVVWVGVQEPTGRLLALQRAIENELAKAGFPRERRAFKPHLTLARIRKTASRAEASLFGQIIAQAKLKNRPVFCVRAIHVIKSDLRPTGPIYTSLHEVPLTHTDTPSS